MLKSSPLASALVITGIIGLGLTGHIDIKTHNTSELATEAKQNIESASKVAKQEASDAKQKLAQEKARQEQEEEALRARIREEERAKLLEQGQ